MNICIKLMYTYVILLTLKIYQMWSRSNEIKEYEIANRTLSIPKNNWRHRSNSFWHTVCHWLLSLTKPLIFALEFAPRDLKLFNHVQPHRHSVLLTYGEDMDPNMSLRAHITLSHLRAGLQPLLAVLGEVVLRGTCRAHEPPLPQHWAQDCDHR